MIRNAVVITLLAAFSLTAVRGQTEEHLCFDLPAGWCRAHLEEKPPLRLTEFVKRGETLENWSEMITLIQMQKPAAADLDRYRQILEEESRARCGKGHRLEIRDRGPVGGAPAQIFSVHCQELAPTAETPRAVWGKAEIQLQLVLAGGRNLYTLQRTRRQSGPAEGMLREWTHFLKSARTCQNPARVPACR